MPETQTPPQPQPLKTIVPAEFHDRPYLKDWLEKPQSPEVFAEVFKKLDGAETLIGRKIGIPGADAKPEEVAKFYDTLAAAKPEEYNILAEEGKQPDPEFSKILQKAFHDARVSKMQADKFQAAILPAIAAQNKARLEAQAKLDAEFDGIVKQTFGEEHKAVLAQAKALLNEHAPAALKAHIEKLGNNELAILTGVITSMAKKYGIKEDVHDPNRNGAGGDSGNLREEGRKLMGSEAYKNAFHADHEKTVARVKEIYAKIGSGK